jgi:outer membrane protein
MRLRLILGWLLVLSLVAAIGYAQTPAPAPTLSLAEALTIARRNNPDYLQILNNRNPASWENRAAFASLFVPTADLSGSYYSSGAGNQSVPGLGTFPVSAFTNSQWALNFNYRLSGRTIANKGLASANLAATDQDIAGALVQLETVVRTQYLTIAEAQAQVGVARRSLERANEQFNLAQARYTVGQGTLIDVRRAEVDTGSAAVNLLRADQNSENQVLVLYQRLGVQAPSLAVTLTDSFPVVVPPWGMDSLVASALELNPGLRSLRSRQASARWGVRAARSEFLPSLFLSADYGRNSLARNDSVFRGTNPWDVTIGVSLPLFEGLQRNARVSVAQEQESDLRQQVRARELGVRAEVVAAFHGLVAAYRAVGLQASNQRASGEALELATQRYRVGSGSFLEQLDARLATDRADADYTSAVYAYHRSIATLEQAVGRPLR